MKKRKNLGSGSEKEEVAKTPRAYPSNQSISSNEPDSDVPEDDDEEEPDYIQWITRGNRVYYPEGEVKLMKKVPSGYFAIGYDDKVGKYYVRKLSYSTDKVLRLPMPEMDDILKDILTFWKKEDAFKKYEQTFKRGILMYGPPGGGKSQIIKLIIKHLIDEQKGIVFKIEHPSDVDHFGAFMQSTFKAIEPNRRIVVIIEDIDGLLMANKQTETALLNILDGMGQMNGIVYLATTNYPEELADRIINRPSRFDRRYEITLPNAAVRKSYFEQILKTDDIETIDLNAWVEQSDGLSIAHLRELIVSTMILGNTFDSAIKLMKDYNNDRPSSRKFKGAKVTGFKG